MPADARSGRWLAIEMNVKRVETWAWVLIYVGLIAVALGLAVQRGDAAFGWGMAATGAALVAVGVLLIWIRSRMTIDNH